MRKLKRNFIRRLRGFGLTVPERVKLFQAIKRAQWLQPYDWAQLCQSVLAHKVKSVEVEKGCKCCGTVYVSVHFVNGRVLDPMAGGNMYIDYTLNPFHGL